eukprot:6650086-Pyramimonas_sp.AAC.1
MNYLAMCTWSMGALDTHDGVLPAGWKPYSKARERTTDDARGRHPGSSLWRAPFTRGGQRCLA